MRSRTGWAMKPRNKLKPWVYELPRTAVVSGTAIYQSLSGGHLATMPAWMIRAGVACASIAE